MPNPAAFLGGFLGRLRYPRLLALTATLLVIDLLVPDLVPLADEIFLALMTALLATRRRDHGNGSPADEEELIDVTPESDD